MLQLSRLRITSRSSPVKEPMTALIAMKCEKTTVLVSSDCTNFTTESRNSTYSPPNSAQVPCIATRNQSTRPDISTPLGDGISATSAQTRTGIVRKSANGLAVCWHRNSGLEIICTGCPAKIRSSFFAASSACFLPRSSRPGSTAVSQPAEARPWRTNAIFADKKLPCAIQTASGHALAHSRRL